MGRKKVDGGPELSEEEIRSLWDNDPIHSTLWISPYSSKSARRSEYYFAYAEHKLLGDQIALKIPLSEDDTRCEVVLAEKVPILPLDTEDKYLSYGTISALAGDFFGTLEPISDGTTEEDCRQRFMNAWQTLKNNRSNAEELKKYLQKEVYAVNEAVQRTGSSSEAYKGGSIVNSAWIQELTVNREGAPGYMGLAEVNWDHFGKDARVAYNAGHQAALMHAAAGVRSKSRLLEAYAMNAFADHYLQDSFSAGHLRTPRRALHGSGLRVDKDLCSKYMHDEDCCIGLQVSNAKNHTWIAYGDHRCLDKDNEDNLKLCQMAVEASAAEIFEAWSNRDHKLEADEYEAWQLAPILESALSNDQRLAPLFKLGPEGGYDDLERRKSLKDRTIWDFTKDWNPPMTIAAIKWSNLWDYPITL